MPVWFIGVPGPQATKFVVVWQNSHDWVVVTWLTYADLPLAIVPLWHDAQPVTMPVWFIGVPGPQAVKFVAEWQDSQAAVVTT
jgi:hypothetical protein